MAKKVSGVGFHVSAQPLEAEWDVPGVVSRKVYQMNIEHRMFDVQSFYSISIFCGSL
jgi:hypothetical protein